MISVDATSAVPPYDQIRGWYAAGISAGSLAAGTRLPTVRALATELGVAVNTVARAYRELEAAGLVVTRGRAGTVVSAQGDDALDQLRQAAATYADLARALGIETSRAAALIHAALPDGP